MSHENSNKDLDYSKYTQDSEIFYNGVEDEDKLAKVIGSIKGVRIA